MSVLSIENALTNVKKRNDDDMVDRANYFYTPMMMAGFALMLGAKQYVGQPLQCWLPAQFKDQWEKYAENYCFIENTYFVGFNETFPRTTAERESRELHYYQWVPFMLAAQVILFRLPKTIWNAFNLRTGIHINSMVDVAMGEVKVGDKSSKGKKNTKRGLKDKRQRNAVQVASHINNIMHYNLNQNHKDCRDKSKPPAQNYVTNLFLFFKLLNLVVCLGQLLALNQFMAPEFQSLWGWSILRDLYNNHPWQHSGHFPRVTYCDIHIREQGGHMVPHTFQCVLAINMFNEKVYIFIWFWLAVLSVMDLFNLCHWFVRSINPFGDRKFIKSHLIKDDDRFGFHEKYCDVDVDNFIRYRLCRDGMTIMRLIHSNCGVMAASYVLTPLFKKFIDDCHSGKFVSPSQPANATYQGKKDGQDDPKDNKDSSGKPPKESDTQQQQQTHPKQPNGVMNGSALPLPPFPSTAAKRLSNAGLNTAHPNTPVTGLVFPDSAASTLQMPAHDRKEMKKRAEGLGVPMDESADDLLGGATAANGPTNYIAQVIEEIAEANSARGEQQVFYPSPPTNQPGST